MTVVGSVLGDGDGVFEVEVADGVSEPALSETKVVVGCVLDFVVFVFVFGDVLYNSPLPVTNINVPLSQNIPHRHLIRPRITGGHDPNEVIFRHAQQPFSLVDREFKSRLSYFRPVRSS